MDSNLNSPAIPAEQVERLAKDIYKWCIKRGYWQDVYIYYNGKRMGTSGMVDGEEVFRYGGEPFIEEGYDAKTYFEYAGPTLSMSFEGPLYHALHHGNRLQYDAESNLRKIFSKYGLYFEYGDYWNLSAFK